MYLWAFSAASLAGSVTLRPVTYVLSSRFSSAYVAGAAFDKDWNVQHIIINNKSELDKLRGSKYVQSRISETLYKDIQSLLEHDKYVLFSGTPCQVAGLKYYLKKDYEKLLLVDILCTYAPSPKVWKKYLEYIVPDNNTIQSINFRDKKIFGWKCSSLNIKTDKSQISDNKYMRAFLSMNIMDPACENCKFAQLSRESDITIADFWGIEKYKKDWNDNKGTSIFMPNNAKGDKIWEILKNKFKRIEKIPVKYAMQRVLDKPFEANINRDNFMQQVNFENFHGAYIHLLIYNSTFINILFLIIIYTYCIYLRFINSTLIS